MKKLSILLLLAAAFACEKAPEVQQPPQPPANFQQGEPFEELVGKTVYNHIRLHLGDLDPYTYLAPEQAVQMKKAFDEFEASGSVSIEKAFAAPTPANARISQTLNAGMQRFCQDGVRHFSGAKVSLKEADSWFVGQMELTKNRSDITEEEKRTMLVLESVSRYGLKAYMESIPKAEGSASARLASLDDACVQEIQGCAIGNIFTYAGYGSRIGGFAGGSGGDTGAAVGMVIGAIKSFASCQCSANQTCLYPQGVTTPYTCYNPGAGLDIRLLGYGNNANGFELEVWDNPQRAGSPLAYPIQAGNNVFHLSDATIQGKRVIYVRPITNCGGELKYAPEMVRIDLNELGKPSFSLSGPTNPVRGSEISITFFGPYADNLQWSAPPYYATILSTHYAYGATVRLSGSPGYGYVAATSTNSCGSLTKWFEWTAQ